MRILFLSNGHGEDQIGSRLALRLQEKTPWLAPEAFPLVGAGHPYRNAGFPVLGPARALPSGGLTMHSFGNLMADLKSGLLSDLLEQLRSLRGQDAGAVVVVGDIWALSLSQLLRLPPGRRFVVQTLVSELLNDGRPALPSRLFMERITLPERWLLRRTTRAVWLRDAETAAVLRQRGVSQAHYAGSLLFGEQPRAVRQSGRPLVLLLPGSRSWAHRSLALLLPLALELPGLRFAVSWAAGPGPDLPPGWRHDIDRQALVNGDVTVEFRSGAFSELLSRASAVIGTAGTAVEQAVAAGLPVLSFVIRGAHTAAFLRNQQRLLAGGLHVAPSAEPAVLAPLLEKLIGDQQVRLKAQTAGRRVLGVPGGLDRIADLLSRELSSVR